MSGTQPETDFLLGLYSTMLQIRIFEDTVNDLYRRAKIPGLAHLYSGEEAVAVGVCAALRRDDYITSTHRGHGHCLAKGADPERMFAELLGRATGYCRGKGGSMHIADQDSGNLGANAIVGGSTAIATGAALSAQMRQTDQVAVCFFGEGALGQGLLYESFNIAGLWKLPVIYVCENNRYTEFSPFETTTAGDVIGRARPFGLDATSVDGQDVVKVYQATRAAVTRARMGHGASFIEFQTYRFHGHHVGDVDRPYRSKAEEAEWIEKRDPIRILGQRLKAEGVDAGALDALEEQLQGSVRAAADRALEAPFPAEAEVTMHVYA